MPSKKSKQIGPFVGKRKVAVAKAVLRPGNGKIRVNSKPLDLWNSNYHVLRIKEPLRIAGKVSEEVDIDVSVHSSGISAQTDAVRTAIARALAAHVGKELEDKFIEYDRTLIVPDMRQNEQSRPGRSKPRASAQKSKR